MSDRLGVMMIRGNQEQQQPPTMPHPLARAMELQRLWRDFHTHHDLRPGDLCRPKKGWVNGDDQVWLLWRILDLSRSQDAEIARDAIRTGMHDRLDCMVAIPSASGTYVVAVYQLARLEPLPRDHVANQGEQPLPAVADGGDE